MKPISFLNRGVSFALISLTLLISPSESSAVDDLELSIQGINVSLTWPTLGHESFHVQYRTNFNAESSWVTLDPSYLSTGSLTTFVHAGAGYTEPCEGGLDPTGGPPPSPTSSSLAGGEADPAFSAVGKERKPKNPPTPIDPGYFDVPPLPDAMWPALSRKDRKKQQELTTALSTLNTSSSTHTAWAISSGSCGLSTGFYHPNSGLLV